MTHELFVDSLNQKIKDNLNIVFYLLVFLLAVYFKLLYMNSGRYYIEHLYYVLHLISFGLIRNILLLPLIMLDWIALAMVITIVTQLTYTFISLKTVYLESTPLTATKVIVAMVGFVLIFLPGYLLSIAIAIFQIMA